MATYFQELLADAARSETAFMAALRRTGVYLMPVDVEHCPRHRDVALQCNWAGLWVCPKPGCRPDRGDDD